MVDKIWYNMEELIGGSEERGINRNILECKVEYNLCVPHEKRVLIETYWNVKHWRNCVSIIQDGGINRNILECKDRRTPERRTAMRY